MNDTPVRLTPEHLDKLDKLANLAGWPDRGRGRAGKTPILIAALLDLADGRPAEFQKILSKRLQANVKP